MKRPGFRLERVLRVRKILEEEARADWAEAEVVAREIEASFHERRASRDQAQERLADELGEISPAAVLLHHDQIDGLTREAARVRERARTAQHHADQAFIPFEERRKDRRALERLHDRDRQRSRDEALRAEIAEQDEINLQRAARERRELQ